MSPDPGAQSQVQQAMTGLTQMQMQTEGQTNDEGGDVGSQTSSQRALRAVGISQ